MNFLSLVQDAFFSNNNEFRTIAEKKLEEFCRQDTVTFLKTCVLELANEGSPAETRQASGTLIMKCLKMQGVNAQFLWLEIEETHRQAIKKSLMATLISKVILARRSAASLIAIICGIELPRNLWPEVISILANNSSNENEEIKKAALLTLGFICEELKSGGHADCISQAQSDHILMGILMGMQESEPNTEIREISIKALHDSLTFMEQHLSKKEVRDFVMKCLFFSLNHADHQVKMLTVQCLIDFSKVHYNKLLDYINHIFETLVPFMMSVDAEIAIPAIEVWNTIANEDKEKLLNGSINRTQTLVEKVHMKLIPILLQNLLREVSLDEGEGELTINDTTVKCLCTIVEVTGDSVLDQFQNFISNTISSDQWLHRRASVIAFGAILEGPSKEKIEGMIDVALIKFVGLLTDPNDLVKTAASSTLSKISEFYPYKILDNAEFLKINEVFLAALSLQPTISRNICWIYNFLSDHFQASLPEEVNAHPFSNVAPNILNHLISNTMRKDLKNKDVYIIDISYMAMINIIHYLKNYKLAEQYLVIFIDQFKNTYSTTLVGLTNLQCGIFSGIHTCLLRAKDIDHNMANQIYTLITEDFKNKKEVSSDGLYAISALATAYRKDFNKFMENFWNFLIYALQKPEEAELFKSAIGSMADISRAIEEEFIKFLPMVIPPLLKCLHSPDFDREIKLHIFLCLGDIALGCKTAIADYLEEIKTTFDVAFAGALVISTQTDPEIVDYAEQLKDKLIESYICFTHALGGTPKEDLLLPHFPTLFAFLTKVCDASLNPTVEFMKNCLALIADIANFYKDRVTKFVKTQFTQNLINSLQKFIHVKENEEMIKYAVHVIQALK